MGIIKAATKLGFVAKGIRAEMSSLYDIPKPIIAHVRTDQNAGHFVVIYKASRRWLRIMDPADGTVRNIDYGAFQGQWSGVLILALPGELFTSQNLKVSSTRRFYLLIQPHSTLAIEALVGAVLYTLLGLSTALYVQKIIDDILPSSNQTLLNILSIVMLAVILLQICFSVGKSFIVLRISQRLDAQLVMGYYKHLLYLPQTFFNSMRVGELISRVNDAMKIRLFISDSAIDLVVNILVLVLSLSLMFLYSAELAVVASLMIPIFMCIYAVTNRLNRETQRGLMASSAELETRLVESIGSVATIKQFALERSEISKTETSLVRLLKASYRSSYHAILSNASSYLAIRVLTVIVLWYGAGLAIRRSITPGELMSFYTLFGYLTGPVFGIVTMNRTIQDALVATDRLYEIMDLEREADDGQISLTGGAIGSLEFTSVTFSYGSGQIILRDLSFKIAMPSFTAIVGQSGSGKSTLVALLQKTYSLDGGSIKIGEFDIRYIAPEELRRRIALVPQQVTLFAGDIVDNVAVGAGSPDFRSVFRACKLAGMDDIIEGLPMKYHTPLGENGLALSGGQRQRIAIARALYRRPDILILDEATASLDADAELYVKLLTRRLQIAGMTIIVISHRLNTIMEADQIIVLGGGRLQETGRHADLIRRNGPYRRLWTSAPPVLDDRIAGVFSNNVIGQRLPRWIGGL